MRIWILHFFIIASAFVPCYGIGENATHFPFRAEILPGYEEDGVKSRCDAMALQPIEGIWYYPDEMMTVVIERYHHSVNTASMDYRVVLVSAEDMSLLPGTVIAYCSQTANRNKYRMWLYSEQCNTIVENPKLCIAELNADIGVLLIERTDVDVNVRVNFSRFLPKLMKGVSITSGIKDVKIPEGFRKIYPKNDASADEVRYL